MNTKESMALVLAAEEFLEAHREELVRRYGDKILVIRDAKVHGAYATFDEAVRAGYTKFDAEPFLVRAATAERPSIAPPAHLEALGLV